MSDYGKLMSRIWSDPDFIALEARPQQMFMLMLSFPTRNYAGVLPLTIRRWAGACADGTPANVKSALQRLIDTRFVVIDWDTEEALIRTFIRNDEVYRQPNLMKAAMKDVLNVSSPLLRCTLGHELLRLPDHKDAHSTRETAKTLVGTLTEPLHEGVPEPIAEGFLEGITDGMAEGMGEGMPEGSGVGVTYVTTNAPAPTPSPSPAPTPAPNPLPGVSKGVACVEDEKPAKRGKRLPEGWKPPDDVIREMHAEFPHVDLKHEHAKFCDYWHAKAGQNATKIDWVKTWRNWIRTAAERAPTTRNGHVMAGPDRKALDWMALGQQEEPTRGLPS